MARQPPISVRRDGEPVQRSNLPAEGQEEVGEVGEADLSQGTLPARAGLVNLILLDRLQRVEAALGVSRGGPALAIPLAQAALDELLSFLQGEAQRYQSRLDKSVSGLQVLTLLTHAINEVNRGRQTLAEAAEQARAPEAEARR